MKLAFPLLLLAAAGLTACNKESPAFEFGGSGHHTGRYLGIGIYMPGELWEQVVKDRPQDAKETPIDPQAARADDDGQIIVVVDSRTGEIRQCGNLSGICIGMNPWAGPPGSEPVTLLKHQSDLDAEREAKRKVEEAAERKKRG